MGFIGRPMKSCVCVDPPGLVKDEDLQAWVRWCVGQVAALAPQKIKPSNV